MKDFLICLILLTTSCNSNFQAEPRTIPRSDTVIITEHIVDTIYIEKTVESKPMYSESHFLLSRIPEWFLNSEMYERFNSNTQYEFDMRMNPFYLEADFNGDSKLDIALSIKTVNDEKKGFIIFHGESKDFYVTGAGVEIKNSSSDNLSYIDIWKINRKKINEAGLEEYTGTGEKGELILKNPSIQIEKSEVGGGQLYWDGKEYAYFHQTC